MNKDGCFFIQHPKIAIVYVYPNAGSGGFQEKAIQFIETYKQHPPGLAHDTVIVCNGSPSTEETKAMFAPLPNLSFINHDNSGYDLGAFQLAARTVACEMMVFFGTNTYFRKPNWLLRMHETFSQLGDTLYGSTGNQGDSRFNVYPHVRTTAFWCSPSLMNRYPYKVIQSSTHGGQRYEMEHGQTSITNWVTSQGKQAWIVGWDSVFPVFTCDSMPNGFHQGNQSNVLVGDRLTQPPYYHTP